MKNLKLYFILTVFFSFGLLFQSEAQTTIKGNTSTGGADFNYSVKHLKVSKYRGGRTLLRINIGLKIGDQSRRKLNMNFDALVYVNGKLKKRISNNVTKGGAITCAVTCAGSCPSIFGDGYCTGCSCYYDNWLSETLGGTHDGDVILVKIVPARGGLKDKSRRDNAKRLVVRR